MQGTCLTQQKRHRVPNREKHPLSDRYRAFDHRNTHRVSLRLQGSSRVSIPEGQTPHFDMNLAYHYAHALVSIRLFFFFLFFFRIIIVPGRLRG